MNLYTLDIAHMALKLPRIHLGLLLWERASFNDISAMTSFYNYSQFFDNSDGKGRTFTFDEFYSAVAEKKSEMSQSVRCQAAILVFRITHF